MELFTEETTRPPGQRLLRIGRRERIDFPEWGVVRVRAKVDTGAFSSAIDVAGYSLLDTPTGQVAEFRLAVGRGRKPGRLLRAPVVGFTTVRSSTGCQARRPVIEVEVRLGPLTRRIRLTIADRSRMRCRMLLGRQALAGAFVVDVTGKDLLSSL